MSPSFYFIFLLFSCSLYFLHLAAKGVMLRDNMSPTFRIEFNAFRNISSKHRMTDRNTNRHTYTSVNKYWLTTKEYQYFYSNYRVPLTVILEYITYELYEHHRRCRNVLFSDAVSC
jgi:hypothetical protein